MMLSSTLSGIAWKCSNSSSLFFARTCASSSRAASSTASVLSMPSAIQCRIPEDTHRLGATLASLLDRGDVVLLNGQVGAGKSELARGIIRSLLNAPDMVVPSPSFLLSQEYPLECIRDPAMAAYHLDLYRLSECSETEWEALGLDDITVNHICLIEWPDVALHLFKKKNLNSYLEVTLTEDSDAQGGWSANDDNLLVGDGEETVGCEVDISIPRNIKFVGVGELWPESRVSTIASLFTCAETNMPQTTYPAGPCTTCRQVEQ